MVEWFEMTRRLRILFQINDVNYKFYWFEYKENNLYWGSSTKRHFTSNPSGFKKLVMGPDGKSIVLNYDPNTVLKEIRSSKFSYHDSGQVHYKSTDFDSSNQYPFRTEWKRPNEIFEPKLFFVVFSKPIGLYGIYEHKNLLRNKTYAMVLRYDEKFLNSRCIFEFYLSPEGKFKAKDYFIKSRADNSCASFSLNRELILFFRYDIVHPDSSFNKWQPDKEIIVLKDDD